MDYTSKYIKYLFNILVGNSTKCMQRYLPIVAFSLCFSLSVAQKPYILQYVEEYKEIAIGEMLRTGIPASIKMAQGILESDAGRSELAQNSNNHFGIKCGPYWEGDTFYKKDDDRDRRGRLIKSCFRVFSSSQDSYRAHSEFLLNPNKAYRYGFLFDLDSRDYKSWAWGLKESGYATNPRYAVLLISIIEEYELYVFDYYEKLPDDLLAYQPNPNFQQPALKPTPSLPVPKQITTSWKVNGTDHVRVIKGVVTNNGLRLVYAQKDETPDDMAKRYDVSVNDLVEFNEGIHHTHQKLAAADRVYFEAKKKKYKGKSAYHTVSRGETMYEIAQIYGLTLDKLLWRNRLDPAEEPQPGQKIALRGRLKKKDKPRLLAQRTDVHKVSPEVTGEENHIVRSGETLYSIAKRYQVSVDELKSANQLQSSLIVPGQILSIQL